MDIIEVKNLSYSYYSEKEVLKDVNLTIEKGKYISILGHNGSGKSTLAKVLMGLYMGFKGEISIDGLTLNNENLHAIRSSIAMVFQNPDNQFIGATVEDDIAFGLENNRVPHGQMAAIVRDFAEKVGILPYIEKEPAHLSGGQKQRVAIAGVLALNPKIVILDEATSMLDPKGKQEIQNLIKQIRGNNPDLTVISITHDIEEAYLSDYCIIMNKGSVYKQGIPEEILDDARTLEGLNLKQPFVMQLKSALREKGLDIPQGASLEEIGDILCQSK